MGEIMHPVGTKENPYTWEDILVSGPYVGKMIKFMYDKATDDGYLLGLIDKGELRHDPERESEMEREVAKQLRESCVLVGEEYYPDIQ